MKLCKCRSEYESPSYEVLFATVIQTHNNDNIAIAIYASIIMRDNNIKKMAKQRIRAKIGDYDNIISVCKGACRLLPLLAGTIIIKTNVKNLRSRLKCCSYIITIQKT